MVEAKWRLEFMQGTCPSCQRSTALALFYNADELPQHGAFRIRPLCVTCGHTWTVPDVTPASLERPIGMLQDRPPVPEPPPQPEPS